MESEWVTLFHSLNSWRYRYLTVATVVLVALAQQTAHRRVVLGPATLALLTDVQVWLGQELERGLFEGLER